jgi:stage V sporulation protein AE
MDGLKLTPAHTMVALVVSGAVLGGLGIYDDLVKFAGAGASVPISSFGNQLVKGALQEAQKTGLVGVLTGIFKITSAGISAAILFGFISALIFKPKG